MLKSLLSILIFLILSFPFDSQSTDPPVDPQTLKCAVKLASEGNITSTPKIKIGERVLAPHPDGGFGLWQSYGICRRSGKNLF